MGSPQAACIITIMKALKAERSEEFKGSFCTIIDTPCNSGAKKKTKVNPFFLFNNGFLYNQRARDPSSEEELATMTSEQGNRNTTTHFILYFVDDADFIRSLRSTLGNFAKPDECPPRQTDTVQDGINGQKRTCPRKCAIDSDCLNDRKLCLCDGACGLSCIRPEKECPELPDPPHGQVLNF